MSACRICGRNDPLEGACVEVKRCQAAVAGQNGSPAEFWIKRLRGAVIEYEGAASVLRQEIARLRALAAK